MHQITIPIVVNIPETAAPFGDDLIYRRMREAVTIPPASRLLGVRITNKEKCPHSRDYVMSGELTFGRWFPYGRKA